jgi:hypothetical protein
LLCLLLSGCSLNQPTTPSRQASIGVQGIVHGGQQPVSGATIQLDAVGTTGDASSATPLIATTLTTSDGTGQMNSNANAGNANNSLPAGSFTISGDYTCPSASSEVYLVATGGNPGLSAGTNNTAIAMMAALGQCGSLSSSTYIFADEVTTIGSLAALYPYMTSATNLGSGTGDAAQLASAFALVNEYTNTTTGTAPGPALPAGDYAYSTEINTLGNVVASCVNSPGGIAGDGSPCGTLFTLATPSGGQAPTNTIGALLDILNNPTQNVAALFNLSVPAAPFQPSLSTAPLSWALPILPAPSVTLNSPAPGASEISGHAYNVDPNTTKVVIYVLTNEWYVQPLAAEPFTNIAADGSWVSTIYPWSAIVVLLVNPANYTPAAIEITNPALDPGVLAWTEYPSGQVSLNFSGYTWGIKTTGSSSGDQFDPGPNFWSNDPSVVNVAANGLQLKITQINGEWQCGEVYLLQSLGYGTYTVQVSSDLSQLDRNAVAAPLFIYAAPGQELDNEYSGSGGLVPTPYNAQFVVQPYTAPGNIVYYNQPSTAQFTTQMQWQASQVIFTAWNGWASAPTPITLIYRWTYTGSYIPPPGQERVHINLWLNGGNAPVNGVGNELVINSFTYQP